MPLLQRVAAHTHGQLLVLGVDTLDSPDSANSFLRAVKVTYPQVVDSDGVLRADLHAPGLPNTVVVRADGTIAFRKLGQLSEDDLGNVLEAIGITVPAGQLNPR